MKLSDGIYPGRIVGLGRTKSGKLFAMYAVTGRSEMSKMRKAVIVGNSIQIAPLGELTPEQEANKDLIIYKAMRVNLSDHTLVVSNGKQSDLIFNLVCYYGLGLYDAVYSSMYTMGFEPDRYKTPRLVGIVLPKPHPRRLLGMVVYDDSEPESKRADVAILDPGSNGYMELISTYTGDIENPSSPILDWHKNWIHTTTVEGETAKDIAMEAYEALNENVRVATAAAVLEEDGWSMDVCNLYS